MQPQPDWHACNQVDEETALQQMVSVIVRERSPEAIILFGSRARGTAREDSDVDLLVIESTSFSPSRSRREAMAHLQLAERTLFSDADAEVIKQILPKLFENDESSARPAGSMEVISVVWWKHNCKSGQYSSAKVHRTLKDTIQADGRFQLTELEGLMPEIIEGF